MSSIAGILVGGRGTRMGGVAKGLLLAPSGETLVARWRSLFDALAVPVVLVGRHEAYANVEIESVADDPPGIGPLGGIIALLSRARGGQAITVACDMPYVSPALLARLVLAPPTAAAIAPRHGDRWEPLFARYDAGRSLVRAQERAAAGELSLQGLLDDLDTEPLALEPGEFRQLRDWDEPNDRE